MILPRRFTTPRMYSGIWGTGVMSCIRMISRILRTAMP